MGVIVNERRLGAWGRPPYSCSPVPTCWPLSFSDGASAPERSAIRVVQANSNGASATCLATMAKLASVHRMSPYPFLDAAQAAAREAFNELPTRGSVPHAILFGSAEADPRPARSRMSTHDALSGATSSEAEQSARRSAAELLSTMVHVPSAASSDAVKSAARQTKKSAPTRGNMSGASLSNAAKAAASGHFGFVNHNVGAGRAYFITARAAMQAARSPMMPCKLLSPAASSRMRRKPQSGRPRSPWNPESCCWPLLPHIAAAT